MVKETLSCLLPFAFCRLPKVMVVASLLVALAIGDASYTDFWRVHKLSFALEDHLDFWSLLTLQSLPLLSLKKISKEDGEWNMVGLYTGGGWGACCRARGSLIWARFVSWPPAGSSMMKNFVLP